jgi:Cof subfamily protein (haloacid dehalogenase superfamily)
MADAPIRLVLSDIDGTLLPAGQRVVSPRTMAAMHACIDAGIRVGPASGRMLSGILPVFGGDAELCRCALANNGMQAYLDGELIHEAHIDLAPLEHVVDFVDAHEGCGLICFEGSQVHLVRGTREGLRESFPAYAEHADLTGELPSEPPVKANVFTPRDPIVTRAIFEELRRDVSGLDFSLPMSGFLDITPKGWNKGAAIDVMCEHAGIDLSQVCVFGDANNDVEMLSHVPCSVAVANASADAKAAARFRIGPVEDEAVAGVLETLASGRMPEELTQA